MSWIIFAVASAVFIALSTVVEKKALIKQHAMNFSATLALFNLAISIVYLPFVNFKPGWTAVFWIFLCSIASSIGFLFLAKGIRHTEISLSSPFLNFGPAVTALLAFALLGESLTLWQVLGIAVLIIGTYVLEVDHSPKYLLAPFQKMIRSKYILFIFFAVVMYGLSSIMSKIVLSGFSTDAFTVLFFTNIFTAIIFLIFISIYYKGIEDIKKSISLSWKYIAIVAVLITASRLALLEAISLALVSLVIPIKRLSTLFVTIIGGTFFHEKGLPLKIVGCIIMLGGVFLIVLQI